MQPPGGLCDSANASFTRLRAKTKAWAGAIPVLTTNLSGEKAPGSQVGVEAMLGGVLVFVFREVGFAYFAFHGRTQPNVTRNLNLSQISF